MRPGSRFARATRGRNMGRRLASKRPMLAGLMIEALNVFATDSIHFGVSAPHTGAPPFHALAIPRMLKCRNLSTFVIQP